VYQICNLLLKLPVLYDLGSPNYKTMKENYLIKRAEIMPGKSKVG